MTSTSRLQTVELLCDKVVEKKYPQKSQHTARIALAKMRAPNIVHGCGSLHTYCDLQNVKSNATILFLGQAALWKTFLTKAGMDSDELIEEASKDERRSSPRGTTPPFCEQPRRTRRPCHPLAR